MRAFAFFTAELRSAVLVIMIPELKTPFTELKSSGCALIINTHVIESSAGAIGTLFSNMPVVVAKIQK